MRQMFGYKHPTAEQAERIKGLRTRFYELAGELHEATKAGRPRAIALTKLQEASWAAISAVVSEPNA